MLAETAEHATEIDIERARKAQERSDERIRNRSAEIDMDRARAALFRAINRLKIASRS